MGCRITFGLLAAYFILVGGAIGWLAVLILENTLIGIVIGGIVAVVGCLIMPFYDWELRR